MDNIKKILTEDSRSFVKSYNEQRYERLLESVDEYLGCEAPDCGLSFLLKDLRKACVDLKQYHADRLDDYNSFIDLIQQLGYTEGIALEVEMTEDEMYRVSLTRDGISATTYVSSMHLVEDKKRQLLLAIEREAARSYAGWA